VGESLGPEVLYLFLQAFILFVLAINVLFGIFIFGNLIKYACVISDFVLDFRSSVNTTLGVL
jgi:hypothetical protein